MVWVVGIFVIGDYYIQGSHNILAQMLHWDKFFWRENVSVTKDRGSAGNARYFLDISRYFLDILNF